MVLLTGCAENRAVVRFASWGSQSEVAIIKPILTEFEAQNPDIKVDFMHIPQNYFQKIHLLFASKTAPDVIFINNIYLPLYADFLLPARVNEKDFYPQALQALSWQGTLYAVPRDISNMVIYYNKDMFRAKGVPFPRDNWDLREFLRAAQRLSDPPRTFGVSFEEDPIYWLPFVMNDPDGPDFYADLRKNGLAPMKSESASATMAQMFLQKRLAMHICGRWMVPKYRTDAKFDWGVAPFPGVVPADASGWAIAKSSKHPQQAQKLVDFLSSHDAEFVKSGLIVPARCANAAMIEEKAFLKAVQNSRPMPVSKDYIRQMDNLKEQLQYKFDL